jgi:hypothetical protein
VRRKTVVVKESVLDERHAMEEGVGMGENTSKNPSFWRQ